MEHLHGQLPIGIGDFLINETIRFVKRTKWRRNPENKTGNEGDAVKTYGEEMIQELRENLDIPKLSDKEVLMRTEESIMFTTEELAAIMLELHILSGT